MAKNIQTMVDHWLKLLACLVISMTIHASANLNNVNITILQSAVAKGAVCLDGSPPAYYHAKGFGEGANNWFLELQGGGWCGTEEKCLYRTTQSTGSSKYKEKNITFGQIDSQNQTENPDFYNWNRVYIGYCDCSSYLGDLEANTNITRRGARIFDAVIEDLLAKGMSNAENAILAGDSAGGLGAILHCDRFSQVVLPNAKRVKCLTDSGFFIHAKHLPGADKRAEYFANVTAYHGIHVDSLPSSCTSRMNASLCLFPENIIGDMKTPLFLVESAFDEYQLRHNFFSNESTWTNCTDNLEVCTPSQLQTMKDYGIASRQTLQEISDTTSVGMFVHSCYRHGHFYEHAGWDESTLLAGKTIAQAIGDWFYDRSFFQEIDYDNELPLFRNCSKFTSCSHETNLYA
ncbi:hypothetical protein ACP275_14G283800 [Erythranthe tilingii]